MQKSTYPGSQRVRNLFKEKDIKYRSIDLNEKASIVERFIHTLKTRMWKYFTAYETKGWIYICGRLVEDYNNTYHRSL